jgi:hypothetical protein
MDYNKILEEAREDPSLFSMIDVDKLLEKVDNANHLENKSVRSIARDIHDAIIELNVSEQSLQKFCNSLIGYRHVDKICDLLFGRKTMWIKRDNPTQLRGANSYILRIDIKDNGIYFLSRTYNGQFYILKFDDYIIFQKLTTEEQLVLMSYEYAQNG